MNSTYDTKANLLIAMQILDLSTFSSTLSDIGTDITMFIDSEGYNIFHDLANSNIPESKVMDFQLEIENCVKENFGDENFDKEVEKMLNAQDFKEKNTPLHFAIRKKRSKLCARFLQLRADIFMKNAQGHGVVHLAAQSGMIQFIMNAVVNFKMRFNEPDIYGRTPMHLAAENSHEFVVALLLSLGQNVNVKDNKGNTALHLAATSQSYTVSRVLIMNYADRNITNKTGHTALDIANHYNAVELYKILKKPFPLKKLNPFGTSLEPSRYNYKAFILYIAALFVRYILWFIYMRDISVSFDIVSGVIFIFTFILFSMVHYFDPGYIKPKPGQDLIKLYENYHPEYVCPFCKVKKSQSARHCQHCGKCVKKYDHHCPWIRNCVGKKNFVLFYTFIVFCTIDFLYQFSVCLAIFALNENGEANILDLDDYANMRDACIVNWVFSLIGLVLSTPVLYIQSLNIIQGRTTRERFGFKTAARLSEIQTEDPRYTMTLSDAAAESLLMPDLDRRTPNYKDVKEENKLCCFSFEREGTSLVKLNETN
ncbi:unnamed protein product [Blepharisma stoltei]|uniref:Palmitoyltransferase n=1 Tax=Blepharisma stoltei TaxID=1481888 RepID=A0AAU9IWY6_9CILI|nr:unnamed protein product [Blepharisma stoltei]